MNDNLTSHNHNPFDFVPFANEAPELKAPRSWLKSGPLVSGYIDLRIQALTPVHIVGRQEVSNEGQKITQSHFFRQRGKAGIPGSSLKGMLRAFIEAACNGWASQMTPYYEKKKDDRHVGFLVTDEEPPPDIEYDERLNYALPAGFSAKPTENGEVDLASFLFGYVAQKGQEIDAWKGRISIEDAGIPAENMSDHNSDGPYRFPDLDAKAFMGGAKPSASSWWYQHPHSIRIRKTNNTSVMEFIGKGYYGRKFYYHQDPRECVAFYLDQGKWPTKPSSPIKPFVAECLKEQTSTNPFRIYFEELPEVLVNLFLCCLFPGEKLWHKIGYGRAYGFGSIDFEFVNGSFKKVRDKTQAESFNERLDKIRKTQWQEEKLTELGVLGFLHRESLEKLAKILWFEKEQSLGPFTYPPFKDGGFLPSVRPHDISKYVDAGKFADLKAGKQLKISPEIGYKLAGKLAENGRRPALHFQVYQGNSKHHQQIESRKLENTAG